MTSTAGKGMMASVAATPTPPGMTPGLERPLAVIARSLMQHSDRAAVLRAVVDANVLADLSRTAAKARAALLTIESGASPTTLQIVADINSRHAKLLGQLAPLISAETMDLVLKPTRLKVVPYEPSAVTEPGGKASADATSPRRFTAQQQIAAIALLAGLHSYLMDLRDADLADAGSLLLVVAALLAVLALANEAKD